LDRRFVGLQRSTTGEGIHAVLRSAILAGRIRQGEALREVDLARDLGTSRTPLREAMSRLEEEGLLTRVPFRGAFVVEVGDAEIAEIASIRLLVEPYAGQLALARARGSVREAVTTALEALRSATACQDAPASIDAHLQFHRLFYAMSGHGLLQELWDGWESRLRLYLSVDHGTYPTLQDVAAEHEPLAEAVLEDDVEAFGRELARHFRSALDT
jgi:DNA-binding GntR family transcriptional regulator